MARFGSRPSLHVGSRRLERINDENEVNFHDTNVVRREHGFF